MSIRIVPSTWTWIAAGKFVQRFDVHEYCGISAAIDDLLLVGEIVAYVKLSRVSAIHPAADYLAAAPTLIALVMLVCMNERSESTRVIAGP